MKAKHEKKKSSILPTIIRTFGPIFAVSGVFQLIYSILQFVSPQVVNLLITFVTSDEPIWKGYFYTILICAVTFINTLLIAQAYYIQYKVGMWLKTAVISAIYQKSLRLSNTVR